MINFESLHENANFHAIEFKAKKILKKIKFR